MKRKATKIVALMLAALMLTNTVSTTSLAQEVQTVVTQPSAEPATQEPEVKPELEAEAEGEKEPEGEGELVPEQEAETPKEPEEAVTGTPTDESGNEDASTSTPQESLAQMPMMASDMMSNPVASDWSYNMLDDDGDGVFDSVEITGYTGIEAHVTIPDMIEDVNVTKIVDNAFDFSLGLKTVIIPDTVEEVGDSIFRELYHWENEVSYVKASENSLALKNKNIHSSFVIENSDYENYVLQYKEDITSVEEKVSLVIAGYLDNTQATVDVVSEVNGVAIEGILSKAFANCSSVKYVVIPNEISYVQNDVFAMSPLKTQFIKLSKESNAYKARTVDSPFIITDVTEDFALDFVYNEAGEKTLMISGYFDTEVTTLTIPEEIDTIAVTHIGYYAFAEQQKLEKISVGKSIERIERAFNINAKTKCHIEIDPETVAFQKEAIYAPFKIKDEKYKDYTFKFEFISDESGGEYLLALAYYDKEGVDNVEIPETIYGVTLEKIGPGIFPDAIAGRKVIVPDSVRVIDQYAIESGTNPVETFVLNETSLAFQAKEVYSRFIINNANYEDYQLIFEKIYMPYPSYGYEVTLNLVDYLDESAMKIELPESISGIEIEKINSFAFSRCENIETVTVSDSVKEISANAFGYRYIANEYQLLPYFLLNKTSEALENRAVYTEFTTSSEMEKDFQFVFAPSYGQYELTIVNYMDREESSVTVPATCGGIAVENMERTFQYNKKLKEVVIPDEIPCIGAGVIYFSGIEYVELSQQSQALLNKQAFAPFKISDDKDGQVIYKQLGVNEVSYAGVNEPILSVAGYTDKMATEITVPNTYYGQTVQGIYAYAFDGLNNLETLKIPESIIFVGEFIFAENEMAAIEIELGKPYVPIVLSSGNNYKIVGEEEKTEYSFLNHPLGLFINGYTGDDKETITELELPKEVAGVEIKGVDVQAFEDCPSLKSVIIPDEYEEIGTDILPNSDTNYLTINKTSKAYTNFNIGTNFKLVGDDGDFLYKALSRYDMATGVTVESIQVSGYIGSGETQVVIPGTMDGKEIKELSISMFRGVVGIKSITIPNTIETVWIDEEFNEYLGVLEEIIVEERNPNYISIDGALYKKELGTDEVSLVLMPPTKQLVEMVLPTARSISYDAFGSSNTKTELVHIPSATERIEGQVFEGFEKLESITVDEGNAYFKSVDGILYNDEISTLITLPNARKGAVVIPETVTHINWHDWSKTTGMTSIEIPSRVSKTYSYYGEINTIEHLENAPNLEHIEVASGNGHYTSIDGVLYDESVQILYAMPSAKEGDLELPNTVVSLPQLTNPNLNISLLEGNVYFDVIDGMVVNKSSGWNYQYVKYPDETIILKGMSWDGFNLSWLNNNDTVKNIVALDDTVYNLGYESVTGEKDLNLYVDEDLGSSYIEYLETMSGCSVHLVSTENKEKAKDVTNKIDTIGEVTQENVGDVALARAAYEALTAEEKILVDYKVVRTLERAEAAAAVFGDVIEVTVDKATATYGDTITATFTADSTTPANVKLYAGETLLGEATGVVAGQTRTITVNTAEKSIPADAFTGTSQSLLLKNSVDQSIVGAGSVIFAKKTLTATIAEGVKKQYDGNASFDNVELNLDGVVSGDTLVATATGMTEDANAGTAKGLTVDSVVLVGDAKAYYQLTTESVTGSVAINQKPLVIVADDIVVDLGAQALPELTYVANGLISGEAITSVTITTTAKDAQIKGEYEIVVSDAEFPTKENYAITYEGGTLTVKYTVEQAETVVDESIAKLPEKTPEGAYTEDEKTVVKEAAQEAVDSVEKAGVTEVKIDTELVEKLNQLDKAFVEATDLLSVEEKTPEVAAGVSESEKLPNIPVEVKGLALAAYGDKEVTEETTIGIKVEQQASQEEALVLNIKPVAQTAAGEEIISNEQIKAPITFKLYLNEDFAYEYALVKHIFDDTKPDEYEIIRKLVQMDATGKYVELTVSQFSQFQILSVQEYMAGDINNDREVDSKDVTRLFKSNAMWSVFVMDEALDVNGDGEVDSKDTTRLFKFVSKWEVEIF